MEHQYKPFIVQARGLASPAIVWAADASHAKELFERHASVPADGEIVISTPSDIIWPIEMLQITTPDNFQGKFQESGNKQYPRFAVPNFLAAGCRAVIYSRVSTPQQAKQTGLSRQQDVCEAFASAADLNILQTYREVESGALYHSRPLLHSALRDLETGRADVLIVESHDRLSHDEGITDEIYARVQKAGGRIIYALEQAPGTPQSVLLARTLRCFHDYKLNLMAVWGISSRFPKSDESIYKDLVRYVEEIT